MSPGVMNFVCVCVPQPYLLLRNISSIKMKNLGDMTKRLSYSLLLCIRRCRVHLIQSYHGMRILQVEVAFLKF